MLTLVPLAVDGVKAQGALPDVVGSEEQLEEVQEA